MLHLPRTLARLQAMCAFYAAQWRERTVHFLFRGDWRSAELISGIGIISTGIVKIRLVTDAISQTPLGIAYRFTSIADIITGFFIIGTVCWSHGATGNARARGIVNAVQFCLWSITAYVYWMGFEAKIFLTQADFEDHFAAIIVMLIVCILDSVNIASIEGLAKKQEGGHNG